MKGEINNELFWVRIINELKNENKNPEKDSCMKTQNETRNS